MDSKYSMEFELTEKGNNMEYKLADTEHKFADIIWDNEPISSGDLVKRCEEILNWKKSTTYTVLKRLCERGIFRNKDSEITSIISREEFFEKKTAQFVEETFEGSLPKFLTAFMNSKKLKPNQAEKIRKMIEDYEEE